LFLQQPSNHLAKAGGYALPNSEVIVALSSGPGLEVTEQTMAHWLHFIWFRHLSSSSGNAPSLLLVDSDPAHACPGVQNILARKEKHSF
jgi:hypothetical protein